MLYIYLWCFLIVSFIGWVGEVGFAAIVEKRFVNRGFLNGPLCPIYGIGVIVMDFFLTPVEDSMPMLVLGSAILGSAVEWVAGFLLEKLFHHKWWDYSEEPFNLNGYICLKFTLVWGALGAIVVRLVMPVFTTLIPLIPMVLSIILLCVLYTLLLIDLTITVVSAVGFNRRLQALEAVTQKIKEGSDLLGRAVSGSVMDVKEKYDGSEFKEKYEGAASKTKQELEELKLKYQKGMDNNRVHRRMLKAFPTMKSVKYNEQLKELRGQLKIASERTAQATQKRNERAKAAYEGSLEKGQEKSFAYKFSPFKLLWVMFVTGTVGFVIEMLSRGMNPDADLSLRGILAVFAPSVTSIGLLVVLFTLCLYKLYRYKDIWVFLCGGLLGAGLMLLFGYIGTYALDFNSANMLLYVSNWQKQILNILIAIVIIGAFSLVWIKDIYPRLSCGIERISKKTGYVMSVIIGALLIAGWLFAYL